MKKGLIAGVIVAVIALVVTSAFAFGPGYGQGMGQGYGQGMGQGYGNCPYNTTNVTPEQQQKFAKFQSDILPLKQKMLQLRTDLINLRAQTPTDWNAIAAKQKEMVDVRTEIQKRATDYGIIGFGCGACGYGGGRMGMGRGMGRMGRW